MKLYVMRHGSAEEVSPTGRDGDRVLTSVGRERTQAISRALLSEGEAPLTIISSPLARARETAEIVATVTDLEERVRGAQNAGGAQGAVEIRREMAPGGNAFELVLDLARSGRKRTMVVGHEPDLSMLVTRLVGRDLDRGMLKSMVVGIRVAPSPQDASSESTGWKDRGNRCMLRFVLDPKTLTWQRG